MPLLVSHVGLPTCPHQGLKIPLVDTGKGTGSFEVMPCTQYGAHPEFHGRYDEVLEAGDFPNRRRLNLRKGTGWVQDLRALRRGTPNRSGHPRPELVICYSLPWYAEHVVTMTRAEYDRLSDRGRELLVRCHVLDWRAQDRPLPTRNCCKEVCVNAHREREAVRTHPFRICVSYTRSLEAPLQAGKLPGLLL